MKLHRPSAVYDESYADWLRSLNGAVKKRRGKSRLRLILEKKEREKKEIGSLAEIAQEEEQEQTKQGEEAIQMVQTLVVDKPKTKYFHVPISV